MHLNGKPTKLREPLTIAGLLSELNISEQVAVERNGGIVLRRDYAVVQLAARDRIEIVTLVGGG